MSSQPLVIAPRKRFIREGRMGPPMSYKTGAVVNTYPKPMLVLEFDPGGLDVVTQPVHYIAPNTTDITMACKTDQAQLPAISCVNFANTKEKELSLSYSRADSVPLILFTDVVNTIVKNGCPWKTIVVDPVTGLTEAITGHIGAIQAQAMTDARRWAFMTGEKITQIIACVQGLNAHTVFIMHSTEDKNELTSEIKTLPMIPSALRERIAALFSQFFYAVLEKGNPPKAYVLTQPEGFVKGIGCRWPQGLAPKCGATFQEIYGSEDKI